MSPIEDRLFPRTLVKEWPLISHGEGVYLFDTAGKRYLDACAGVHVVSIGHGVPELAADLTGSGTVLLVEDEDAVRLFGARALRNKGYTVLEAENGEDALDVINATDGTIDLIISDVVMPGMDGHTLVRLVRHELPDVKVIRMSGYAEDVFQDEIERDPTIQFLPKPFSLRGLAAKVKDVMKG